MRKIRRRSGCRRSNNRFRRHDRRVR